VKSVGVQKKLNKTTFLIQEETYMENYWITNQTTG
jgi:hypothetical protein